MCEIKPYVVLFCKKVTVKFCVKLFSQYALNENYFTRLLYYSVTIFTCNYRGIRLVSCSQIGFCLLSGMAFPHPHTKKKAGLDTRDYYYYCY